MKIARKLKGLTYLAGLYQLSNIGQEIYKQVDNQYFKETINESFQEDQYAIFYKPKHEINNDFMNYFKKQGLKIKVIGKDSKLQQDTQNISSQDEELKNLKISYIIFDHLLCNEEGYKQCSEETIFLNKQVLNGYKQKTKFISLNQQENYKYIDEKQYRKNMANSQYQNNLFKSLNCEYGYNLFKIIKVSNIKNNNQNLTFFQELLTEEGPYFAEQAMKRVDSEFSSCGTIKSSLMEYFLSSYIFQWIQN